MKPILVTTLLLALFVKPASSVAESSDFISTWRTTVSGESITLPLINGGQYNFSVDWGDGSEATSVTFWSDKNSTHVYAVPGDYTVTITGQLEGWSFNNGANDGAHYQGQSVENIVEINQWGSMKLSSATTSAGNYFYGATHLDITATDVPDLTHTTNMTSAFRASGIDSSGNLNGWNVEGVTGMQYMFRDAAHFNQPIDSWNVEGVTAMYHMFFGASVFNQAVGSWNVEAVTSMNNMFRSASAFNQDISSWNVEAVTVTYAMFRNALAFNQDISNWNVEAVVNMNNMFRNAPVFNQDISRWNVGSVTTMWAMFRQASAFNQDIGGWNVEAVTDMKEMFLDATLSTVNYNALLTGWGVLDLQNNVNFHAGNSKYSTGGAAEAARSDITSTHYWTIHDGGAIIPGDDSDNDGVEDEYDPFPNDPTEWADNDYDGVGDNSDNCVFIANSNQLNSDGDKEGNACDPDDDNDGQPDNIDAFPLDRTEWSDSDGDGVGDNKDALPNNPNETLDSDVDGVGDNSDNCPYVPNADQSNHDGDSQGDRCDPDDDNDDHIDVVDAFPMDSAEWVDSDGDGVGDNSDAFPSDPAETTDSDGDGVGDNSDVFPFEPELSLDSDDDGVGDRIDNCPMVGNPDQSNNDGDVQGDACDPDDDNDGVRDENDGIGSIYRRDHDNDGYNDDIDSDDDNDGIDDELDGKNATLRLDHDNDGINDGEDEDDDNDGRVDDLDGDNGAFRLDYDNDGLVGSEDRDNDNDGIDNEYDTMPYDTDNDGLDNRDDRDDDNDGITDILEGNGLVDSDDDGNPDSTDTDSDGDTLPDIIEAGSVLTDADGNHKPDHFFDIDLDGLHDDITEEFRPIDSDHDGVADYLDLDSDNDGVEDGEGAGVELNEAINAILASGGAVNFMFLSILSLFTMVLRRRKADT